MGEYDNRPTRPDDALMCTEYARKDRRKEYLAGRTCDPWTIRHERREARPPHDHLRNPRLDVRLYAPRNRSERTLTIRAKKH